MFIIIKQWVIEHTHKLKKLYLITKLINNRHI